MSIFWPILQLSFVIHKAIFFFAWPNTGGSQMTRQDFYLRKNFHNMQFTKPCEKTGKLNEIHFEDERRLFTTLR